MRYLRILSVIAIVAMFSAMAIALPPPWSGVATGQIPVVMDIAPAVSIDANNALIKLLPDANVGGLAIWSGVADPQPILRSNVRVSITATLDVVNPVIQTDPCMWGVALQGQDYKRGETSTGPLGGTNTTVTTTPPIYWDAVYIGTGRGVPIAVFVANPTLWVRAPEANSRVATVTLTATPF